MTKLRNRALSRSIFVSLTPAAVLFTLFFVYPIVTLAWSSFTICQP